MKRFMLALVFTLAAAALHAQNVKILTIHAKSLENNLLGDPADQKLAVYLPPATTRAIAAIPSYTCCTASPIPTSRGPATGTSRRCSTASSPRRRSSR
ncbi:MAG TPA: hypothetical protein VMU84_21155 [Thermoanaerobaculia bacterium]|nr:hypothetical protein [Thermoanaerobaculia bacterium]